MISKTDLHFEKRKEKKRNTKSFLLRAWWPGALVARGGVVKILPELQTVFKPEHAIDLLLLLLLLRAHFGQLLGLFRQNLRA